LNEVSFSVSEAIAFNEITKKNTKEIIDNLLINLSNF